MGEALRSLLWGKGRSCRRRFQGTSVDSLRAEGGGRFSRWEGGGGGVSLFPSLCAWRGGGRCLERGGEMLILLQLVVAGAMGRRNYYFGGSETQANTADTHWREGKKKGF